MEVELEALPFSKEIEQALLGSIAMRPSSIEEVYESLKPEYFYDDGHKKIYKVIIDYYNKHKNIDIISINQILINSSDPKISPDYLSNLLVLSYSVPYESINNLANHIIDFFVKRNLILLAQSIIGNAKDFSLGTSAFDQISDIESRLFNLSHHIEIKEKFTDLSVINKSVIEIIDRTRKNPKYSAGIETGFIDIDKYLLGFQKSELIIIAGRPSMGKTSLALNLALNISRNKESNLVIGFFSLEMSNAQIALKILSNCAKLDLSSIKKGKITEEEYAQLIVESEHLSTSNIFIDDDAALSLASIRNRSKRLKRQRRLDIIFIDYLQLIRPTNKRESRVLEVAEITQGLKALAKELDIPIIALSQLSRAVESRQDRKPALSDLRESGTIEQDADIVILLYRESYYLERNEPKFGTEEYIKWEEKMKSAKDTIEVLIAKHRNGPVGKVVLNYIDKYSRFDNYVDMKN